MQAIIKQGIRFLIVVQTDTTITLRRVNKDLSNNRFYPFDIKMTLAYYENTAHIGASIFVSVKDYVMSCLAQGKPIGLLKRHGLLAILPHENVSEITTMDRTKKSGVTQTTTSKEIMATEQAIISHTQKLETLSKKLIELQARLKQEEAVQEQEIKQNDMATLQELLQKLGLSLETPKTTSAKPRTRK